MHNEEWGCAEIFPRTVQCLRKKLLLADAKLAQVLQIKKLKR